MRVLLKLSRLQTIHEQKKKDSNKNPSFTILVVVFNFKCAINMQKFLMFSILFHKDILNEEIRLAYLFKDIITLYQGRKMVLLNSNATIQR